MAASSVHFELNFKVESFTVGRCVRWRVSAGHPTRRNRLWSTNSSPSSPIWRISSATLAPTGQFTSFPRQSPFDGGYRRAAWNQQRVREPGTASARRTRRDLPHEGAGRTQPYIPRKSGTQTAPGRFSPEAPSAPTRLQRGPPETRREIATLAALEFSPDCPPSLAKNHKVTQPCPRLTASSSRAIQGD